MKFIPHKENQSGFSYIVLKNSRNSENLTKFHLFFQVSTVNLNNPDDCGKKFRSNRNLGLILLGAIIMGTLWKREKPPRKKRHDAEPHTVPT